jgi:hypothetical protein
MIDIIVKVEGDAVGPKTATELEKQKARVQQAVERASRKLADNILSKGRADISGAGRFGSRWTQGLTAGIAGEGAARTITLREAVPYWRVFQFGAIIKGKPVLWIPFERGAGRARDYHGRLFRVPRDPSLMTRKSGKAALLIDASDKQPKYFAKTEVRIPKKFHLVEIARAEANTFGALYRVEMASD